MAKLRYKVPKGATKVVIGWDKEKQEPKLVFEYANTDNNDDNKDNKNNKPPDTEGKKSVSVGDHLRSFFTGEGPGAFASDEDDEDDSSDDGDDNDEK